MYAGRASTGVVACERLLDDVVACGLRYRGQGGTGAEISRAIVWGADRPLPKDLYTATVVDGVRYRTDKAVCSRQLAHPKLQNDVTAAVRSDFRRSYDCALVSPSKVRHSHS